MHRTSPWGSLVFAVIVASCGKDDASTPGRSEDGGGIVGDEVASFADGGGCGVHCSADLHQVLDCNGAIVTTCPADQGCGANQQCALACDAARENKSTIGCDYYSANPEGYITESSCYAAFVANTWSTPVAINVEYKGQVLNASAFSYVPVGDGKSITYRPLPSGQLPPGQVAILFLAQLPADNGLPCPQGVTVAINARVALMGTGLADAFHITTNRPVVAYDIFPYGGGSSMITSAALLLPTSAWDTNYITQSGWPGPSSPMNYEPYTQVVAQENGTQITIVPRADIVGGNGVAATGKGQPHTYTIDKGQILQFAQNAELTGSVLQSTKPVGVWGGHSGLVVPDLDTCCADSAHQQIPPVKALGHEYVGVRYRNRIDNQEETVPWRIVGAVDGTQLSFDPPQAGAPTSVDGGEITRFDSTGPFSVKSQDDKHPFYISGHMTGSQYLNGRGDAEWVNIIPPQQYLASYVFFTDPTYPETNLVVVRQNTARGFQDVELDCAGVLQGWQAIGAGGQYQYTRIDLVRHDFQPQGNCDNGRHEMHSSAPFGLTVWGWGTEETVNFTSTYVSYAYPAGESVQPINTVVVPPVPK